MLLAQYLDSRTDFLATWYETIGNANSFYMFWFQKMFHSIDALCHLSRLYVWPGFRLLCALLAVHFSVVYSVSGSLRANHNRATATNTMALQAWVIIICSFLFRSFQINNQPEIVTFCIFERTWTTTANFWNFPFEFWHRLTFVWDISDSLGHPPFFLCLASSDRSRFSRFNLFSKNKKLRRRQWRQWHIISNNRHFNLRH